MAKTRTTGTLRQRHIPPTVSTNSQTINKISAKKIMRNFLLSTILFLIIPLKSYGANENYLTLRNLILKIEEFNLQHRSKNEIVSTLFNDLSSSYDLGFIAIAGDSAIQIIETTTYSIQCITNEDLLYVLGLLHQHEKKIKSILKSYQIDIDMEKYFCDFLISRIDKVRNSRIFETKEIGAPPNKVYDFEYQINDDDEYEVSWYRNNNCEKNDSVSMKPGYKILTVNSIPTKYITNIIADSLFFHNDSVKLGYTTETGLFNKTFKLHFKHKEDSPYTFSRLKPTIAYLKINHFFEQGISPTIAQEFLRKNYDRIIIDLRNNTGGYIQEISKFTGLFLNAKDTISIFSSNKEISTPVAAYHSKNLTKPELVILINSSTASGANLVIQMLRKGRKALVVGENSYIENSIHSSQYIQPKMYLVNLIVARMVIKTRDIAPDYYINDCIDENGDNILNYALSLNKQN